MMKKMDKKAFTIIELLVVIAVVGILVLLGAPRFAGYTQRAELTRIQHDIKVMEQEVGTMLINGDDDFNKWENNIKDFNQLAQDNELFEKEGPVKVDDLSVDGPYKVIPEEYKNKINTKLKGTFYAHSGGKVYYEHGKMPGYSDEEIQDLIGEEYIPIATEEDLNSIRSNATRTYGKGTQWEKEYTGGLNKKYVQVANIDLSEYSEEGWIPIGTETTRFKGTYDGGNYVITNLEVNGGNKSYQGLFGYTDDATISNVGLIDNKVTGNSYVGGLVGWADGSTNISNSYTTGSVTGKRNVGGLVGYVGSRSSGSDVTISNSYATGSVTGDSWVGGLLGNARYSTIENSYATGLVTGSVESTGDYVGGLVGDGSYSTISNSYATGSVTGRRRVGGLVGDSIDVSIENSYATGEVKGTESWVGGLVGEADSITIENSYATGSVTGYWSSIGGLVGQANSSSMISNSYATGEVLGLSSSVGGLVGYARESTIENSYATGSVTSYRISIGGLVGRAYSGTTIRNSYATGEVRGIGSQVGRGDQVGGLVGEADSITIENSYATGSVIGNESVGGLVGDVDSVTIDNSYWDKETTGQEESAGQVESFGKTTVEMKKQTTYGDWNFDNIWKIDEDIDYPKLR